MKLKVCKGCSSTFTDFIGEDYCINCSREREAVAQDKCLSCGGPGASTERWGCCEKCSN